MEGIRCTVIHDERLPYIQGWAKGLINQSSDTDSMFRSVRPIQSVIFKFKIRLFVLITLDWMYWGRLNRFIGATSVTFVSLHQTFLCFGVCIALFDFFYRVNCVQVSLSSMTFSIAANHCSYLHFVYNKILAHEFTSAIPDLKNDLAAVP